MSSQTNVVACLKLECHNISKSRQKAFFYVSLQKLHVGLYFQIKMALHTVTIPAKIENRLDCKNYIMVHISF